MKLKLALISIALVLSVLGANGAEQLGPPDEIAGSWCLEQKNQDEDGVEVVWSRGDCSTNPNKSLQIILGGYRIGHDLCDVSNVTVWLGTHSYYKTRYSMLATCKAPAETCKLKVSFYLRTADGKLGMWFLPEDIRCVKKKIVTNRH
jgi:hypothetical protein